MRKNAAPRRDVPADPLYESVLVTQIINKVLLDGKRSTAERIVYSALSTIGQRTSDDPVATLKRAIDNVKPPLEVRSRRVGGATYQVPVEVRPRRANTLAIRWVVEFARARRERCHPARRSGSAVRQARGADGRRAAAAAAGAGPAAGEHRGRSVALGRLPCRRR